jgi:hypothetical protein
MNEDFEDSLMGLPDLDNILIPNDSPDDEIEYEIDEGCSVNLFSLESNELMKSQVDWMKKTYEEEIAFLRKTFGHNNIQIRWGLLSWWS